MAFAPLKSADKALTVHEGQNDVAVGIIARALDDEQVIVKDVRFDHRVAGVAREEGPTLASLPYSFLYFIDYLNTTS